MAGWKDREGVHPEEKKYSVVKMDSWKAPTDDDFAIKIAEIDSLDEGPYTTAGRGESIVILDRDGNTVSVTDGPDHPTETTTRDETRGTTIDVYDYSENQVVARVSDDGVVILEDYFETVLGNNDIDTEELTTIVPGNEEGDYFNATLRPGDPGYARVFVNQIPSPFDPRDHSQISELAKPFDSKEYE